MEVMQITGGSPEKYALNLMDTLFTDEEMKGHLFIKSVKSKSSREALPQDRVKKLIGELFNFMNLVVILYFTCSYGSS